jgi:hypothetical protein
MEEENKDKTILSRRFIAFFMVRWPPFCKISADTSVSSSSTSSSSCNHKTDERMNARRKKTNKPSYGLRYYDCASTTERPIPSPTVLQDLPHPLDSSGGWLLTAPPSLCQRFASGA